MINILLYNFRRIAFLMKRQVIFIIFQDFLLNQYKNGNFIKHIKI